MCEMFKPAVNGEMGKQLCLLAAYLVSNFSPSARRTTKPFNPLLGETFECDRTTDLGWKSIAEQVRSVDSWMLIT